MGQDYVTSVLQPSQLLGTAGTLGQCAHQLPTKTSAEEVRAGVGYTAVEVWGRSAVRVVRVRDGGKPLRLAMHQNVRSTVRCLAKPFCCVWKVKLWKLGTQGTTWGPR